MEHVFLNSIITASFYQGCATRNDSTMSKRRPKLEHITNDWLWSCSATMKASEITHMLGVTGEAISELSAQGWNSPGQMANALLDFYGNQHYSKFGPTDYPDHLYDIVFDYNRGDQPYRGEFVIVRDCTPEHVDSLSLLVRNIEELRETIPGRKRSTAKLCLVLVGWSEAVIGPKMYRESRRSVLYQVNPLPEPQDMLKKGMAEWNQWRREVWLPPLLFDEHNLHAQDFREYNFSSVRWRKCHLAFSVLQKADCTYAEFDEVFLDNINAVECNMRHASFKHTSLCEADLRKADLKYSQFQDVAMLCARLQGANMQEIKCLFSDTVTNGIDLSGADLSLANAQKSQLQKANFSYAVCEKTNFSGSDLRQANFDNASLVGANLCGADLRGATFYGANLSGAHLQNCMIDTIWDIR